MINCTNLKKIYNSKGVEYLALNDITLNIEKGSFCVLQGPSGSGKTTLLNMLGCIDLPTSGQIVFDDVDTKTLRDSELSRLRGEKIGFIFQSFNLISVLSAYENVKYPLVINKRDKQSHAYIKELFNILEIWELRNKRPEQLSGGQQQRVAIARALVMNPALVLADEPTANLDSKTGKIIVELMHKIYKDKQTTFIISTHDPNIAAYADRLIKIKDGKIKEEK